MIDSKKVKFPLPWRERTKGAEEQGSRGAEVQRSRGAEEQGSRGAGVQRSKGAGEQGSRGERAGLRFNRDLLLAFMASFVGFFVDMVTTDALAFPTTRIAFWIFAGVAMAVSSRGAENRVGRRA